MHIARMTKWLLLVIVGSVLAGCATQRTDWKTRIGNYTYDQAVEDYGPSDKHEKLADGTVVADWLVRRGHNVVNPQPYLVRPDGFGPAAPYNTTYVPDYFMRLIFGPDGRLKGYKNFTQ